VKRPRHTGMVAEVHVASWTIDKKRSFEGFSLVMDDCTVLKKWVFFGTLTFDSEGSEATISSLRTSLNSKSLAAT
jgi:hypothetical protein